jgi:hypothetical protein
VRGVRRSGPTLRRVEIWNGGDLTMTEDLQVQRLVEHLPSEEPASPFSFVYERDPNGVWRLAPITAMFSSCTKDFQVVPCADPYCCTPPLI